MDLIKELSSYYLNAYYMFLVDKGIKPYIQLKITENTKLPPQYNGQSTIVLNINPEACGNLIIDKDGFSASIRFNGKAFNVYSKIEDIQFIHGFNSEYITIYPFCIVQTFRNTAQQASDDLKEAIKIHNELIKTEVPQETNKQEIILKENTTESISGRKVKHLTVVK